MSDYENEDQVEQSGDSPAHEVENSTSKRAANGDSRRKSASSLTKNESGSSKKHHRDGNGGTKRRRKSRSVSSSSSSSSSSSRSRHHGRKSSSGKKKHHRSSKSSSKRRHHHHHRKRDSRSPESRSKSRSPRRSRRSRTRSRSKSYDDYGWKANHFNNRGAGGGGRPPFRKPVSGFMQAMNDPPPPSRCLGVFGLNLHTDERTLEKCFSEFGRVETIQIVYDKLNDRSRGFGFIYFENIDDAIDAKEKLTGTEIDGHRIRVDYSLTKRPHTPTPGMYMGKRDGYPSYGYGGSRRRSRSASFSPRR